MTKSGMIIKRFIVASCLVFAAFSCMYLIGINADPYQESLDFIDHNNIILNKCGMIKSKKLSLFGYTVQYSGPDGWAKYKILVNGEKCEDIVYLDLKKTLGQWRVIHARLFGQNSSKEGIPLL